MSSRRRCFAFFCARCRRQLKPTMAVILRGTPRRLVVTFERCVCAGEERLAA